MLQQALQKLQKEIGAAAQDRYVQVVGGFLIKYVRENPEHATAIITEGKTIRGCLDAMKAEARKNQSGGVGMLTGEEGFAVVLSYFGIEAQKPEPEPVTVAVAVPSFDISVDDLL